MSDTLSEKNKLSAILKSTIFFSIVTVLLITGITLTLKTSVTYSMLEGYKISITDMTMNKMKMMPYFKNFLTKSSNDKLNALKLRNNTLQRSTSEESNDLSNHVIGNKIFILNGNVISDNEKLISKDFKMEGNPTVKKFNDVYYIFVSIDLNRNHELIIGSPSLEYTELIKTFDQISIYMIFIGLFLSMGISYFMAKKTLTPLKEISSQISKIKVNTLHKRIPAQKSEEFQLLADKLNEMLDDIENGYDRQRSFVSDVSHELRTPLTAISGHVRMLKRWGLNDEKVAKKSLDSLENSSAYLVELVEKLLILSKPNIEIEFKNISVKNSIDSIAQIYMDNDNIININGEDFDIFTSDEYFTVIIKSLIENGLKYSKPDNKTLDINLKKYSIEITDYGIGMEQTELDKIFDKFYKADKSRNKKSFGLGLAIAKRLADMLGIKISVQSKLGEGSTFILTFEK